MVKRNGRATSSSQLARRANTDSVSTTRWVLLLRNLLILRSPYVASLKLITYDRVITDWHQVENEQRASIPSKQGTSPEQTSALEESIFKLSGQLSTITRNQKYFRTRENRNFSTVRSTERRIFNFSVIESLMMMCMAGLQVFIVRFFFQGARKGYVWAQPWWDTGVIGIGGVESLGVFLRWMEWTEINLSSRFQQLPGSSLDNLKAAR